MKLVLCTLAICLALLASVLTTQELIRAEGKRVRAALPRALVETEAGQESVVQKLDSLSSQLAALNRRLGELESSINKREAAYAASLSEALPLPSSPRSSNETRERLAALSLQLAETTTFLDRSFEHLESHVSASAATPDGVKTSLADLKNKLEDFDRYFKTLYSFLGLSDDRHSQDALNNYPSLDARVNDLQLSLEAVRVAVEEVRKRLTPVIIEPTKHPR